MSDHPILFAGPLVLAILDGWKTVTRRLITLQPNGDGLSTDSEPIEYGRAWRGSCGGIWRCPFGWPGDRLWVRETWASVPWNAGAELHCHERDHDEQGVRYRATWDKSHRRSWRPSIHMPRWASRITLAVTSVRVERLQDLTEEDAKAEGVEPFFERFPAIGRDQRLTTGELAADAPHRASFAVLWDELNAKRATWKSNPWVWRVAFKIAEVRGGFAE